MKRWLLIVAFFLFAGDAVAQSETMLKKAERNRRAAEEKLGRQRLQRTNERVEWTQKMQNLHAKLAKLESQVDAVASEKQNLESDLGRIEKNKQLTLRRIDSLAYALRRAAGYPSSTSNIDEIESFKVSISGGIEARLKALVSDAKFRIQETEVLDRSGKLTKSKLVHLGKARTMAVGSSAVESGLVRKTEDKQWLIDGASLLPEHYAMLEQTAQGKAKYIPIDIDGSLVQQSQEAASSSWLEDGGSFVWPIILVGLLGLCLLLERIWYLFLKTVRPSTIAAVKRAVGTGDIDRARTLVQDGRTDLERLLSKGIETIEEPLTARESALEEVLLSEEPRLERSLTLLAAAAGVAPLLGLLGTVTGMIGTFDVIAQHGTGNPRLLSGGISMALITTQLGLIVAVPLLLGHAWISRAVEKRQALLEEARTVILAFVPTKEKKQ